MLSASGASLKINNRKYVLTASYSKHQESLKLRPFIKYSFRFAFYSNRSLCVWSRTVKMRVLILSTRIVKMLKAFVQRMCFWHVQGRCKTVLTWNKIKIRVFILDANHVKSTQICSDKKQKHLRQYTRGKREQIVFCFWLFLSNLFPLKKEDILNTNFHS